eukprot:363089-Chlamydomonas_euryale.AAC.5
MAASQLSDSARMGGRLPREASRGTVLAPSCPRLSLSVELVDQADHDRPTRPWLGCGWVVLSATVARRSHDGAPFRRRSCDGSRNAGLGPPAGGPRPSGNPSRMKSCARAVDNRRRAG